MTLINLLNGNEYQMKYVIVCKDLFRKLYIYIDAIYILKKVVAKTNPEYDLVAKRLHLYYNMKLITFSMGKN